MNYYDELIIKINNNINDGNIVDALLLIEDELKQSYIPREIEKELISIKNTIKPFNNEHKEFDDDEIANYLKASNEKQLIAVEILNKKNLRNYFDLCYEYLKSDAAFVNAKLLLIDSLVNQEIGKEFIFINNGIEYTFIPKYVVPVVESDGFISGKKYLEDVYLKEPSKLKMSMDLLYKETIMQLPINIDENEGIEIAKNIIEYINKAFN